MVILSQNDCVCSWRIVQPPFLRGIKAWASVSSSARLLHSTQCMTRENVLQMHTINTDSSEH